VQYRRIRIKLQRRKRDARTEKESTEGSIVMRRPMDERASETGAEEGGSMIHQDKKKKGAGERNRSDNQTKRRN
jgi:hypothetical protein